MNTTIINKMNVSIFKVDASVLVQIKLHLVTTILVPFHSTRQLRNMSPNTHPGHVITIHCE